MGSVAASSDRDPCLKRIFLDAISLRLSMKKAESRVWVSVWVSSAESQSSSSLHLVCVWMSQRLKGRRRMSSSVAVWVSALEPSQGLAGVEGLPIESLLSRIVTKSSVWVPKVLIMRLPWAGKSSHMSVLGVCAVCVDDSFVCAAWGGSVWVQASFWSGTLTGTGVIWGCCTIMNVIPGTTVQVVGGIWTGGGFFSFLLHVLQIMRIVR